uniref:E3 ubiquitin-protein ligase n=1 Tax=Anopheles dirus TaxID=7168 RepID=A0A182N1M0_9DIPT
QYGSKRCCRASTKARCIDGIGNSAKSLDYSSLSSSGRSGIQLEEIMSAPVHRVVVWEHELPKINCWLPYSPCVTQLLERAYTKNLTRVLLKDAEPELEMFEVNLVQMCQTEHGTRNSTNVRRCLYPPNSPAAMGIRWEWYSQHGRQMWRRYPLDIQSLIEQAWANGEPVLDLHKTPLKQPFIIDLTTMTETSIRRRNGKTNLVRRMNQAPYPLLKVTLPAETIGVPPCSNQGGPNGPSGNRGCNVPSHAKISNQPIKHHGTSQHPQSTQRNRYAFASARSMHNAPQQHAMPEPFESQRSQQHLDQSGTFQRQQFGEGSDAASSHKGRRPSVDTVSTYLSHESQTSSRHHLDSWECDMLNSSIGSDEVFMPVANEQAHRRPIQMAAPPLAAASADTLPDELVLQHSVRSQMRSNDTIPGGLHVVGVTQESKMIAKYVQVADPPRWPRAQPCPMCMEELRPASQKVNVALIRCRHQMHLDCLNLLLAKQRRATPSLEQYYIECPTCMSVYGVKYGNQPHGTMTYELMPGSLPGFPATGIYEITYNFTSGVQGPQHPNSGAPFFAVGFPRRCYLPNTVLGAKILYYLDVAFGRGLLFTIGRSVTTGNEDVVMWTNVEHMSQLSMLPDPQFLDRCLQQLVHLGVTD